MGKMVDMLERRAKKARKTNMAELKDDTSTTKLERQDVTEVSGGRNPKGHTPPRMNDDAAQTPSQKTDQSSGHVIY